MIQCPVCDIQWDSHEEAARKCIRCREANQVAANERASKGHPAAPLLRELAEVAEWHPGPWREFQIYSKKYGWVMAHSMAELLGFINYHPREVRRRPRTKRIGEYDVPPPVRKRLVYKDSYFVAAPAEWGFYVSVVWNCDDFDSLRLKRGLIHLDPESAATHGKALASLMSAEDAELMQEDEGC